PAVGPPLPPVAAGPPAVGPPRPPTPSSIAGPPRPTVSTGPAGAPTISGLRDEMLKELKRLKSIMKGEK
ncbi:MAG: hypothetical protein HWN66_04740, partial [Candidatus Helarchaeota archaeon]|nr:hypothetical protein [Candidatus Helarchaeota archaeon]